MGNHALLHPTEQTLSDFSLGKLDDGRAEIINNHLNECPDCQRRVAEMSSDSFLGRLQGVRGRLDPVPVAGSSLAGLSQIAGEPASAEPPPSSSLPPGLADHPDYEVLRELGQGGMGTVYLAQNRLMGRNEVLKVVSGHLIKRRGVLDRFQVEIRNAGRLHHTNIVTAYSASRLGESIMFAMEYVEGLDLSKLVKAKGPLPVANACNYVHQACLGLQHAHEHGMVHRDIKPSNLMLARQGERAVIKVLDFGLAKIQSEGPVDGGLTHEGQMLGTPDYIAPEQIRDARGSDIRADIYSLGCTLYYLLTGGPPFQATSLYDLLQAHHSMDAMPLNLARPEVPVELAALVGKMMAKEPVRRFQEPREVSQVLTQFFKKWSIVTAESRPEMSAFRLAGEGQSCDVAPHPEASQSREPARPESQWESLVDVRESETAPIKVTTGIPRPGRIRSPWVWPSVATGVLLLGLVFAWAAGLFKVTTANGVIALEFNPPKEIRPFNGSNFEGWNGLWRNQVIEPSRVFRIEGDEFVWAGAAGRIFLNNSFEDFSFKFEYLLPLNGRYGTAFCRLRLTEGDPYQFDQANYRVGEVGCALTNGKEGETGDIVFSPYESGDPSRYIAQRTADAARPANEWNEVEIRCTGREISFILNGCQVNRVVGNRAVSCHPGFNSWDTDIRFRKISKKSLVDTRAASPDKPSDRLQRGTEWIGQNIMTSAHSSTRTPPLTFRVLERKGEKFTAEWRTTPVYGNWMVNGTIQDGQISWLAKDVTFIKGNESEGYDTVGTIQGDEIRLKYSGIGHDHKHEYKGAVKLYLKK
jgi:serine/threonine protein kinase